MNATDLPSTDTGPAVAGPVQRRVSRGSEAMKHCHCCGITKPTEAFGLNRTTKDGLQSQCNDCRRQWRVENRARIAEKDKAYRDAKGELLLQKKREYFVRTRETRRDQRQKERANFYANNPDYNRQYYLANKTRIDAKAADARAAERLTDSYVAAVIGLPTSKIPRELLDMKREQLLTLRLARALKRATHEGSQNLDRITGEHGSCGNAG